ncbi:MAG: biosynthetic peptidoglycan transglycosylase, partial [Burkholderiaceae bacterium]
MTWTVRVALGIGLALGAGVLLISSSLLLALAAVGVFATTRDAWTSDLSVGGGNVRVNVVGLVRLATLPGVAHLLDGRSVHTRSGPVRFSRTATGISVTCAPCRLQHPDLALVPIDVRLVTIQARRHDDALDGTLIVDTVRVAFTGRLRSASIELTWQLPATELASIYRSLGSAVPEATLARIEGTVSAEGTLSLPSRRASVRWNVESLEVGGLGTEPLQYGWFRFSCGRRDGSGRLVITGDGEKPWVAIDAMGPYLAAAVLAAEDQRFHQHDGYDEQALAEILGDIDGRPRRGGSTLTQQLARTLFTGGDRTAVRKLRELLYAIEMERTLGKSRILELYLNTVDWGPGVCGAKAAARAYFNKVPARLTALESAWLAGVLRNPHMAWETQFVVRQPDRARPTQVLMQMRDWP